MSEQTGTDPSYVIAGVNYSLVPALGYQQCQWLGEHVLNGIDLQRLDPAILHDVIRTKGPLAMAICLLADGVTRAQHATLSWDAITARAREFAAELSPEEVLSFSVPFFLRLQPASVAVMIPGNTLKTLWDEANGPSPAPSATGSSTASSPSVEETLHELLTSSPSGDRPSPSPISGDASSERPSIEPSLAGSVSSFPG